MTQKTIGEQIADLESTRNAKAGRMTELTNKTLAENRTKDAGESEEFSTLKDEIKSIDQELEDLHSLEAINSTKAVPVPAVTPGQTKDATAAASASRGGSNIVVVERKLAPGVAFARFAGVMAHTKGNMRDALDFANNRFPEEKGMHDIIKMFSQYNFEDVTKAAVAVGTTSGTTWAAPLVQYNQMASEFIDFLRPQTIVGRIPNLRQVPFNISMPRQTSGGAAYWVGEGQAKPLTSLAFDQVTLRWTKLATIAVISDELARFSQPSAETILRDQLAAAVIQQMDADFVNPANAGTANVKPASITNGVTAVPSSGSGEASVNADIQAVFAPFIAANLAPTNAVWIMSATNALGLSLMKNALGQRSFPDVNMAGGTFWGMPVIVSEAVGNIVILANAQDILLADDGQVSIDASREASLQMDSAPDSPPTATTVMVSLWQNNLLAIRAERYVNWLKARPAAVQYLSGVSWNGAVTEG
ncbi:phage major capsid protein [Schauerella aestuarii]|uniref:phage major capsid protein n=1 Tax=Schauerella aestuarii TaxID=2511204 RepID=UPI001928F0A7|nr:phage major capsid protein [Achromobacter aestuarii]